MKNLEVARQLQRLNSLITRACKATDDLELQAHWARYFTVLAAGMIENALPILYGEYVDRVANKAVARYANGQLGRIQNPKSDRFIEITRQFSDGWAVALEAFILTEGRKDAIDSIMSNRHLVAHGKDTGITVARLQGYLTKAGEVLEFIEKQLNPQGSH